GWARPSPISISRCSPAWDIFRTGRIPIARQARSRPSSTGETEPLFERRALKKMGPPYAMKYRRARVVSLYTAREVGVFADWLSDGDTLADAREAATQSRF